MTTEEKITITIHGLAEDNGLVRAEIFNEKLSALIKSLKIAEKYLNNKKKSHHLILTDLKIGSALASLREKVNTKKHDVSPGAPLVAAALNAIYNGDRHLDRFPQKLIKSFDKLTSVRKEFSHGEVEFGNNHIIRLDHYLEKQTERALERSNSSLSTRVNYYQGLAFGVFDGILKEIDARGALLRGKLILTAGGKEVECIFRRDDIPILRESFEHRARVEAIAHYDSDSPLPVRLDVRNIELIKAMPDLARWRGALSLLEAPKPGEL